MPAKRKKSSMTRPWDPAAPPPGDGPSLANERQRQFHATHFSADPRGAAMSGAPPEADEQRGEPPPETPRDDDRLAQAPARKRGRTRRGPEGTLP